MAYYIIIKTEASIDIGKGHDPGGGPGGYTLTTGGTVDPGSDGDATNTFVTAPVDLVRKGMNGKSIVAFVNISGATASTIRSKALESLTFDGNNTATVTITDFTELNGDGLAGSDNVNLIATDTTNYNFYVGDQSSVSGTWEATDSNEVTATNLMNVINTSSGPSGSRFTATVDGAVVTITQATIGAAGATVVTLTDSGTAGMTKTNFISGYNSVDGGTITLIDAAGTSATFTGRNATTVALTNEFLLVTSADTAAENFLVAVNANPILITASRIGAVVTLRQDTYGTSGNTTITTSTNFDATTSVNATSFALGTSVDMFVEFSPDGTNWTKYSHLEKATTGVEIADDIDTETTGYLVYKADLSYIKAPYARFGLNSQAKDLGALEFNIGYSYPVSYIEPTEKEFWTTQGNSPS